MTPPPVRGQSQRVVAVVVAPLAGTLGSQRMHGVPLVDHVLDSLAELPGCDVVMVGDHPERTHRPRRRARRGVRTVSPELSLSRLLSGYDVVLVHDPLCPLVPAAGLVGCLAAVEVAGSAAGVLAVTDTVKRIDGDVITATVDRDTLHVLAAPVAFDSALVEALEQRLPRSGDLGDLEHLVDVLGDLGTVRPVRVPPLARRVGDDEDIAVLECLDGLRHSLRER